MFLLRNIFFSHKMNQTRNLKTSHSCASTLVLVFLLFEWRRSPFSCSCAVYGAQEQNIFFYRSNINKNLFIRSLFIITCLSALTPNILKADWSRAFLLYLQCSIFSSYDWFSFIWKNTFAESRFKRFCSVYQPQLVKIKFGRRVFD